LEPLWPVGTPRNTRRRAACTAFVNSSWADRPLPLPFAQTSALQAPRSEICPRAASVLPHGQDPACKQEFPHYSPALRDSRRCKRPAVCRSCSTIPRINERHACQFDSVCNLCIMVQQAASCHARGVVEEGIMGLGLCSAALKSH
jgi:hypothetical protein